MKLEFIDRFSKNTSIKFHENPFSRHRATLCGRTEVTKLNVFLTVHHELTIHQLPT